MFYSNSSTVSSEPEKKQDYNSIFIMVMMVLFVSVSVFRKMYDDPVMFKVEKKTYNRSFCKKYVGLLPVNVSLSSDEKFHQNYYEVIHIAKRHAVISYLCDKLGIVVSDNDMRESILNDYSFFEENSFSRAKFINMIEKSGINENQFYELRREKLRHKQFWFLIKNSYSLPSDIVKNFNNAYYSVRHIRFAKVNHSDVKLNYSDKDLLIFYDKNKDLFKTLRSYSFNGFSLNLSSLTQADLNLLKKMVSNNNFSGVLSGYKSLGTSVSNEELLKIFGPRLSYFEKNSLRKVGECEIFQKKDKIFICQVESVNESSQLSFEESKKHVISLYERKNKPLKIDTNNLNWSSASFSADDFYLIDLPYSVSQEIFALNIGKLASFHKDGFSYFVIVDSIKKVDVNSDDDAILKDCLDTELYSAIINSLVMSIVS